MKLSNPLEFRPFRSIVSISSSRTGPKGEVDLSDLAGKGVFEVWDDYGSFERVFLGNHREITWTEEIELSADSLYLRLTGKSPAELFPSLRREQPHA